MSLQIVRCNTKVITVIGNIKAIVTGCCIRENDSVSYELSYFNQGLNVTCWVKRVEFEIDVQEKKQAGFVNYEIPNSDNCTQIFLSEA